MWCFQLLTPISLHWSCTFNCFYFVQGYKKLKLKQHETEKKVQHVWNESLWYMNIIKMQVLCNSMQSIVEQTLKRSFLLCMEIDHGETSMIMSFCPIYMTSCNWPFVIDTVYFNFILVQYYQRTNVWIYDHTSIVGMTIITTILQCMILKLMRI